MRVHHNGLPVVRDAPLLQVFVRSLVGVAFTWHANLLAGPMVSWQMIEQEFLSQFCNTKRRTLRDKTVRERKHDQLHCEMWGTHLQMHGNVHYVP